MGGVVLFLVFVLVSSMKGIMVMMFAVAGDRPPAMYVFGESTLDVGNNNYLTGEDVFRANMPYNGIDFPGFATGRYSNGHNTADYVAKGMGFARSPPAYLSMLARNSSRLLVLTSLRTGVNYASGGAGILDSTNAGDTIPLSKQVQYFKATKAQMIATQGSGDEVNALLARSVFLIGIGTNDMIVFPDREKNRSLSEQQSNIDTFYENLISNYSATITELFRLKFAIINVGLLGCAPVERLRNPAATTTCWDRRLQQQARLSVGQPCFEFSAGTHLLAGRLLWPHGGHPCRSKSFRRVH